MGTYMNDERQRLHTEIIKSQNTHAATGGKQHYEYNVAAGKLSDALAKKRDVTRELDVFEFAYGQIPTPPETTGLGRAQAAGINRQRKVMFSAIDEVRKQIRTDFRGTDEESDRFA